MRVLLALDGSPHSVVTEELVAALSWPRPTLIQLIRVGEDPLAVAGIPDDVRAEVERAVDLESETDLAAVAARLRATGCEILTRGAHGRPASVIVDEAVRIGADLVVVGSRGRGALTTMLLGSVAAEVVDRAPCPVLVARGSKLKTALLADDGSHDAYRAARLLSDWPFLRAVTVTVVSVAPVDGVPVTTGPTEHAGASESVARSVDTVRRRFQRMARDRALELSHAGLRARALERTGDAAEGIVGAAVETAADLVVMGSRGHTGLSRLLLGSVARDVLVSAPCSVLIARRMTASR